MQSRRGIFMSKRNGRGFTGSTFGGPSYVHNFYSGELYAKRRKITGDMYKEILEDWRKTGVDYRLIQFFNDWNYFKNYILKIDLTKFNSYIDQGYFFKLLKVMPNVIGAFSGENGSEAIEKAIETLMVAKKVKTMTSAEFDKYCESLTIRNDKVEKKIFINALFFLLEKKYRGAEVDVILEFRKCKFLKMELLNYIDQTLSALSFQEIRIVLNNHTKSENENSRDDTPFVYRSLRADLNCWRNYTNIIDNLWFHYRGRTFDEIKIAFKYDIEDLQNFGAMKQDIMCLMIDKLVVIYQKMTIDEISDVWKMRDELKELCQYESLILRILYFRNNKLD